MSNQPPATTTTPQTAAPDAAKPAAPKQRSGGPSCRVCAHAQRDALDRGLLFGEITTSEAARIVNVHRSSVTRHVQKHVLPNVAGDLGPDAVLADIDITEEVRSLYVRARKHMHAAEQVHNPKALAAFHREARADLELLAKLTSQLQQEGTGVTNITINPQWVTIRAVLFSALQPWPEARAAVAAALLEVDKS